MDGKKVEEFQFGPWNVKSVKSHILESACKTPDACKSFLSCSFCRYHQELNLSHLPDMVFPNNLISVTHDEGFGISFNALDALKRVKSNENTIKVAGSEAWFEARSDCEHINSVVKPFDWTFTTDYAGTLLGDTPLLVEATSKRISMEKLKQKEKILFYDDVTLYEDELADNGSSCLSVKIRVMPSSFFLLQRFYLRVDDLLVRMNDTRLYHEAGSTHLIREYSTREKNIKDSKLPPSLWFNPNQVSEFLDVVKEDIHLLSFPGS